jgi:hypothetical protein
MQQKHAPLYESICSLDELDEKSNHLNFQTFEILKERVARQRTHFLNHLIKKLCSMGLKCLSLDVSHM